MQSKLEAKYLREIGEKVYSFFFENPEMENNNLEFREGQSEMACEIVDAISQKKNLVVEAGVGIGKSFAYLVPLIYYNYYLQKPVVIATSTITLQEQLQGDIRYIMEKLQIFPEVLLAKGMTNFICRYHFKRFFDDRANLKQYEKIYECINQGGKEPSDWNIELPLDLWQKFRIKNYNYRECKYCEYRDVCHYHNLRLNLKKTKGIIICNQDMLTTDLRLKREMKDGLFTEELSLIVVDEAHNLEDKVRSSYTDMLTRKQLVNTLKRCYLSIKKIPPNLAKNIDGVFSDIDKIFKIIDKQIKYQIQQAQKQHQDADRFKINIPIDLLQNVYKIAEAIMIAHAVSIRKTGGKINSDMEIILDFFKAWQDEKNYIVWAEDAKNPIIYLCPTNVNEKINELFFGDRVKLRKNFHTIFTSATLTNLANEDLTKAYSYFIQNTMFPINDSILSEVKYSPFAYDKHAKLFYTDDITSPSKDRGKFIDESIDLVKKILDISQGKALILFTSKADMNAVYTRLKALNLNYTLIKQNEISSQQQLIYKFKQDVNSVLLGTGVFWEGISIEGIALSNLIIYKLPFPLPEPIINEKCKRSKNPLEEVLVPEMIIKLKQGVGRLIRNKTDKGIVSIIDSRLGDKSKASYKEKVWQALPIKQRTNSLKELQSFYDNL